MIKKYCSCLIVLYLLITLQTAAQNMNHPYSVYGIGDIDMHHYNMNAGMGYTGIALKTTSFFNGNNPASASGMLKGLLVFDVNALGELRTYSGTPVGGSNSKGKDFTIKNAYLSIKPNSLWASGIGFKQFSNVDYQFQKEQQVVGANDPYTVKYMGDGGLVEYYWNNAFTINKHFSVGLTASFINGAINQTDSILNITETTVETVRKDFYQAARLEYGAIYNTALSKNWGFSIGTTYTPQTKMAYERTLSVKENDATIVDDEFLKNVITNLPSSYGIGIGIENKNGVTYAIDYSIQKWSSLNLKGTGWKLVDANRLSAGAEFTSSVKRGFSTVKTKSIQIGAYINNSYLQVNGHTISEYGVTIGGKTMIRNRLLVGGSLEAGVRGTTSDNLIRENYIKMTLSFSLRDFILSNANKFH